MFSDPQIPWIIELWPRSVVGHHCDCQQNWDISRACLVAQRDLMCSSYVEQYVHQPYKSTVILTGSSGSGLLQCLP